jgi:hypothetical protein
VFNVDVQYGQVAVTRDRRLLPVAQQAVAGSETKSRNRLVELGDDVTRLGTLNRMHDVVFSHDGRYLYVVGEGYRVEFISTETWQREAPMLFDTPRVFALTRHPQHDMLAIGGFDTAAVDATALRGGVQRRAGTASRQTCALRFVHCPVSPCAPQKFSSMNARHRCQ